MFRYLDEYVQPQLENYQSTPVEGTDNGFNNYSYAHSESLDDPTALKIREEEARIQDRLRQKSVHNRLFRKKSISWSSRENKRVVLSTNSSSFKSKRSYLPEKLKTCRNSNNSMLISKNLMTLQVGRRSLPMCHSSKANRKVKRISTVWENPSSTN